MKRFKKMQFADLLGIVALDREWNGYAVDEKSAEVMVRSSSPTSISARVIFPADRIVSTSQIYLLYCATAMESLFFDFVEFE